MQIALLLATLAAAHAQGSIAANMHYDTFFSAQLQEIKPEACDILPDGNSQPTNPPLKTPRPILLLAINLHCLVHIQLLFYRSVR